ncbi:MAG: NUDIX domain-containing protein [Myxococcota bacterium]
MTERRTFSVAIFARHAGRVLLIRHKRLGTWLPVGGELEPGETPLEAARRELFEETGFVGTFAPTAGAVDGTPPGLIGYEEHAAGSKGLHLNFVFVADVPSRDVRGNDEFDDHRWVADTAGMDTPTNVTQLVRIALGAP